MKPPEGPLRPVEELLFGRSIKVQTLHPEIREIYSGAFQQLDEMDKVGRLFFSFGGGVVTDTPCDLTDRLDEYLSHALAV